MVNGADKHDQSSTGQTWLIVSLTVLIIIALVAWGWSDNWTYWGPKVEHHASARPIAGGNANHNAVGATGAANSSAQRTPGAGSRAGAAQAA